MSRIFLFLGALFGGLSVSMGAFGAHIMRGRYSDYALEIFEKAVRYEMYHALALLGTGLLLRWIAREEEGSRALSLIRIAGWLFAAGILFFSGSLTILAFTGVRWLGAITPVGGVSFVAGWILLAAGALRLSGKE